MKRIGMAAAALLAAAALATGAAADEPSKQGEGGIPLGKDGAPNVIGKIVGQDIPDVHLAWSLNDDGRNTVADFRGEVVIVDLWSTTCGPCRGLIPTLSKHQKEHGKDGLQVFGITGEKQEVLVNFLAHGNVSEVAYKMASGSSGGMQSPGTVPYAFVVDVDGKVVWQGHGGPPGKVIEAELKKVKAPTAEQKQARAQKVVDRAVSLAAEKRYLRATELLDRAAKTWPDTEAAKTAAAKLKEIQDGAESAKELAAQKALAKILGGTEAPAEKLSKKERQSKVAQIEALLKKEAAAAPGTKEIAEGWMTVLRSDAK